MALGRVSRTSRQTGPHPSATAGVSGTVQAGSSGGQGVHGSVNAAPHGKAWNETPQGQHLSDAYDTMRATFAVGVPAVGQQLRLLTHRHIGG